MLGGWLKYRAAISMRVFSKKFRRVDHEEKKLGLFDAKEAYITDYMKRVHDLSPLIV